jgi:drug/metabolite transporter superfamily protein YnfA
MFQEGSARMTNRWIQLLVMIVAAALEVGGDALIRRGLTNAGPMLIVAGFVTLGSYGIVVNQLALDFSVLLGAYVGVFAIVSVLFGRLVFAERVAQTTWIGLGIVLIGSGVIYYGQQR